MSGLSKNTYRRGPASRTTFGHVTNDFPQLDRIQNGISAACGVVASACIIAIAILTLMEIIARTLFHSPLGWSFGIIENYLMVSVAFFGMVTAYRSGAHVAVVSLFNRLSVPAQKVLLVCGYVVVGFCLGFMLVAGWRATTFAISIAETIPPGMAELSAPGWTWRSIVPVASALGLAIVLIDLYKEITTTLQDTVTVYERGDTDAVEHDLSDNRALDSVVAETVERGGRS